MTTLTKPFERKGWRSLGAVICLIDRETVLGLSSRPPDAPSIGVCDDSISTTGGSKMPQYLYQLSYTAESLAAQIQDPQDRIETAGRPLLDAVGGKLLGGGSFGEYDVTILIEAPDDETAAAVSVAVVAGGAIRSSKTTKLLSGEQWVAALGKASDVAKSYEPAS